MTSTTITVCFAHLGHEVTAIDINEEIVAALHDGTAPITDPGVAELLATHAGTRLTAPTAAEAGPDSAGTGLAIGTPSNDDGSIDLGALEAAAMATGEALADKPERHRVGSTRTGTPPRSPATLEPAG